MGGSGAIALGGDDKTDDTGEKKVKLDDKVVKKLNSGKTLSKKEKESAIKALLPSVSDTQLTELVGSSNNNNNRQRKGQGKGSDKTPTAGSGKSRTDPFTLWLK